MATSDTKETGKYSSWLGSSFPSNNCILWQGKWILEHSWPSPPQPSSSLTGLLHLVNYSFILVVSIFTSALMTHKSPFPVSTLYRCLVLYHQLPPKYQPPPLNLTSLPIWNWLLFWPSPVVSVGHHSSGTCNSCLYSGLYIQCIFEASLIYPFS